MIVYGGPGASSAALLFGDLMLYLSFEKVHGKRLNQDRKELFFVSAGP
jgi:hypothetical protein